MTRDEILKLAKKVGLYIDNDLQPELIVFANLVAAAERDACKEICVANGALGLAAAIRARGNT